MASAVDAVEDVLSARLNELRPIREEEGLRRGASLDLEAGGSEVWVDARDGEEASSSSSSSQKLPIEVIESSIFGPASDGTASAVFEGAAHHMPRNDGADALGADRSTASKLRDIEETTTPCDGFFPFCGSEVDCEECASKADSEAERDRRTRARALCEAALPATRAPGAMSFSSVEF